MRDEVENRLWLASDTSNHRPGRPTMISIHPRSALLALAAAVAVSGGTLVAMGAPASAAEIVVAGNPVPTARVAYDDLNLASAAGVKRLEARIRVAADQLCFDPGLITPRARLEGTACRDAVIAAAAPQVSRATQGSGSAAGQTITLALGR
jgi:UrcA family protein